MPSNVGRLVVDVQTNKSGGAVAYGDIVINDGSNAHSFTTTTTGAFTAGVVGVCIEPNGIANNATGRIQFQGYCAQVNANASVTNGYFLKTHTVAKQAAGSATRVVGAFGVALSTSATPAALLWGFPDATSASGNVAADSIWDAKGDLAAGTGADTGAKLPVGSNGQGIVADSSTATGLKWVETLPWRIDINPVTGMPVNTGFTLSHGAANISEDEWADHGMVSTAQNDQLGCNVVLAQGTWSIFLLFYRNTTQGICTVSFDGVSVGTIDNYGAGQSNTEGSITGISVAASGKVALLLKMATKNASASAYNMWLSWIVLVRTA